jgi:hypothetical protein
MVDAAFMIYEVFGCLTPLEGNVVTADLVSAMNTGKVLGQDWMY